MDEHLAKMVLSADYVDEGISRPGAFENAPLDMHAGAPPVRMYGNMRWNWN
jgi:hypothetical protein